MSAPSRGGHVLTLGLSHCDRARQTFTAILIQEAEQNIVPNDARYYIRRIALVLNLRQAIFAAFCESCWGQGGSVPKRGIDLFTEFRCIGYPEI
jgi:hypothetical protein